jgi:hypothetical protein
MAPLVASSDTRRNGSNRGGAPAGEPREIVMFGRDEVPAIERIDKPRSCLSQRAARQLQELQELAVRVPGEAFRNVGGHRAARLSDLIANLTSARTAGLAVKSMMRRFNSTASCQARRSR